MPREFSTPEVFSSSLIASIKNKRALEDPKKKDFSPSVVPYEKVEFYTARFFGFCYGVQNAVELAYHAVSSAQNGSKVYLLSELIHNPKVNSDLVSLGVQFLRDTSGNQIISLDVVTKKDLVILPAFGVSPEVEQELNARGIDTLSYDSTCPFVKRVWNKGEQLGHKGFTLVIHGKPFHEETKATFGRVKEFAHCIVVRNKEEAEKICTCIRLLANTNYVSALSQEIKYFFDENRCSPNFDPVKHLRKLGVINQTTMLAEDTLEITSMIRDALKATFGEDNIGIHFADTRDTLCYATSENQNSVKELLKQDLDFTIVIGGYNSSNTTHLAKICSQKFRTFHVEGADDIISDTCIRHWDSQEYRIIETHDWIKKYSNSIQKTRIGLTAGASTPDSIVEQTMHKIQKFIS
jgi:4-hydroxy-3-methylbut-2-en-1-yl diphosphate reductase